MTNENNTLEQAYLIVARKEAIALNYQPSAVINLLEIKDGKVIVKKDIQQDDTQTHTISDEVKAVIGDFVFEKLVTNGE
jgi:hypothetical protein